MILSSRPLRFLGGVVGGWACFRAAMLWPVSGIVPSLAHAVAPAANAETSEPPRRRRVVRTIEPSATPPQPPQPIEPRRATVGSPATGAAIPTVPSPPSPRPTGSMEASASAPLAEPKPLGQDPPPTFRESRWSGSAWAILRPDGRAVPFASQLGGSQAGARLAYALGAGRRVAVYARISTAIDAREREVAVGLDWRPTRLPVHLIAERRIGIEGVRSGTAIGAVGGVGPTRIVGPVRIEGYAQAGVIFRDRREGFADGSLRLTVPALGRIDLGLGAWGGAQRGAARVDVGPTVGVAVPVVGRSLRLSVDWRERVAGDARPGSGPAVSLGVDF